MIGLKRYTVKLVPHDDSWHILFKETKKELLSLIGDFVIDIQHVGSTSIKNIEAKPILDIAISVNDLKVVNKMQSILEQHGYEYRGDGGKEGGHLFVKCSDPDIRTHHIHVVDVNDIQWNNFLKFRDLLNSYEKLALEYSKFKRKLAKRFKDNRKEYTNSKKDFIDKILNEN